MLWSSYVRCRIRSHFIFTFVWSAARIFRSFWINVSSTTNWTNSLKWFKTMHCSALLFIKYERKWNRSLAYFELYSHTVYTANTTDTAHCGFSVFASTFVQAILYWHTQTHNAHHETDVEAQRHEGGRRRLSLIQHKFCRIRIFLFFRCSSHLYALQYTKHWYTFSARNVRRAIESLFTNDRTIMACNFSHWISVRSGK